MERYNILLSYIENDYITRNYAEKSINNLLDMITENCGINKENESLDFLENYFRMTLKTLEKTSNDVLSQIFINLEALVKNQLKIYKISLI